MCEKGVSFKLCSCKLENNKNSRRSINNIQENNPSKIIWTLYQYDGEEYLGIDGITIPPAEQLDELFTADHILGELNKRHCFDFSYNPKEGDYLVFSIYTPKKHLARSDCNYLPFLYRNGFWVIDSYNPFYEKITQMNTGKITIQ